MRYASIVSTGILLSAALFASCTCHKEIAPLSQQPSNFPDRGSGFIAKSTPAQARAEAPTPTPAAKQPEQVAVAPTSTGPAEMPADFPKEVPVYKDATVSQVQSLANNAHNVIFSTAAPVNEVSAFYQQQLTKAGWKVSQQFARPNHAFMTFQKDNMLANVTVTEDAHNPGHQVIAIMYEEQKPLDFEDF